MIVLCSVLAEQGISDLMLWNFISEDLKTLMNYERENLSKKERESMRDRQNPDNTSVERGTVLSGDFVGYSQILHTMRVANPNVDSELMTMILEELHNTNMLTLSSLHQHDTSIVLHFFKAAFNPTV